MGRRKTLREQGHEGGGGGGKIRGKKEKNNDKWEGYNANKKQEKETEEGKE